MYFFQTLYFCCFWWYTSEKFENKHVLDCIWSKGSEKLAFFTLSTLPPNGTFMDGEETYRPPFSAFKDSLIAYFILSFFPKRDIYDPKHLCMPTHFSMIFLRNERLASQFWACPFVAEKILVFCHLCHTYLAPEKVTGMLPFFRATIVI